MDALGIMLDEAKLSLSKFIQDSYIFDNLSEGILNLNTKCELLSLNQKAASLFHLDRSAIGKHVTEIFPDGELLKSIRLLAQDTFRGRAGSEKEIIIRHKNGNGNGSKTNEKEVYWVKNSPIRDQKGGLLGINITFRDTSDVGSIRNQIQKIERLAAIGSVATKIAHEVRNPLASMRALLELMQEDFEPGGTKSVYASEILNQIDHLNSTFEDILSFSREPVRELEVIDINSVVARAVAFSRYNMPAKPVVIEEAYQEDVPLIMADSERLSHVFCNILKNAFEATPDDSCLKVYTKCEGLDSNGGRRVKVVISDNGPGIDAEVGNKIFEPFFTTKPKGTGLGLSMAYQIVAAHQGSIEFSSEPGKGATFSIFLPVTANTL